ncbi:patatin-like phospholipase family protein [Falsiroseomonas oryzae]|uniref:patatin-like phospholipase family protein n=1 Tax=Falsiroseomonas oryzae TaxID=2766473 RepID=UPI0022EA56A9|nr:patatin-like phospholipase family protein [Roseomonas sp. MO-31]
MSATNNPTPEPHTFQIGLCMAGAVSAGAYTAGMLDFLIEALDSWEAARARGERVPSHRVRLRALSGASAGGMCAAILAALLYRRFPPARAGSDRSANPLWRAWVEGPRIEALLDPSDRGPQAGPLRSLLNVRVLQQIVDSVLDTPGEPAHRPWVASSLPLALSLGNLRGVPYGMSFGGANLPSHKMRMHADSATFVVGTARPEHPDLLPLENPASSRGGNWPRLGQAALASGAFPLFLQARALSRPGTDYLKREILVPGDGHPDSIHRDAKLGSLVPDWPKGTPDPYDYLCVDGGVFDNEPLDLCRRFMMDAPGQRLVRDGRFADRSVLMVDPFPDSADDAALPADTPLQRIVLALVEAWKMQSRFGAVDVALAAAPDVYSRMMLVPSRGSGAEASGAPLAAGGLGAFLGFFHQAFREHDFQLGRRNCQRFLRLHLALPTTNPLFGEVPFVPADATHEAELVQRWQKTPDLPAHYPVIPLIGACAQEERLPDWPRGVLKPDSMAPPIRARMDAVVKDLLRPAPLGYFGGIAARGYWWWKRDELVKAAIGAIATSLREKQLA